LLITNTLDLHKKHAASSTDPMPLPNIILWTIKEPVPFGRKPSFMLLEPAGTVKSVVIFALGYCGSIFFPSES